ncbi:cilia- and flagella-associated protein 43 [Eucyclogobius newberryi]|uniref:cilia- and flagella-associated protein 43 n=1 Tax=Eucyclogobius newberryi TaxID=166745 RepID=UPI003B5B62DD
MFLLVQTSESSHFYICLACRWIQGFTNKDVYFVDKSTVAYPCGNYIYFLDLTTKKQSIFQGPGSGVSVFTANGNNGVFAFTPRGLNPSIFVHSHPTLGLNNELTGSSKLDYISLALSDGGPYLVSCSSLPDFTITVWNWENATPLCQQERGGNDACFLVFNPWNWLQICAIDKSSLTVWNIERNGSLHVLKPCPVELPDVDGANAKRFVLSSHSVSEELCYFGPEMPPSAIAGLKGDKTEDLVNKLFQKARVTPAAICWTTTSQLYVGCREGFLLLVDPENLSVSTLFNPKTPNEVPELKHGFQALALHKDHLIAVGKNNVVHDLQIKGTQIKITETWELACPVTTILYSPNYETLLCTSDQGQIFALNKNLSENITKILDVSRGDFVALSFSPTDNNICLTVRDPGQLQVWSTDGTILSSLSLQTKITCLACCPIANYVVLGTACGKVVFIEVRDPQQPRVVHQTRLYHTSVEHLVFNQHGHYLFASGPDSYLYVLDPKPSSMFAVLGYTVLPSPSLTLSAQYVKGSEQVKVLALCVDSDKNHSRQLTLLSLPAENFIEIPNSVERNGCLSNNVLNVSKYEVPYPLTSCALGNNEIFAYCHEKRSLQCFEIPQHSDSSGSDQSIQLNPVGEVKGHALGPASLALSPHRSWLASLGRDGVLQVRGCASMDECIELQCHSLCSTGVQLVAFSADSQNILTANTKDGSLVCTDLRMSDIAIHQDSDYEDHLKSQIQSENSTLSDMKEWNEQISLRKAEESQGGGSLLSIDVTEQDEKYKSLSHKTWLESRGEAIVKEDNEKYSETKKNLRKGLKELHDAIQDMMRENENVPEMKHLEQKEFNLDVDEQKVLEAIMEEEVLKVRTETEWDILAKCYDRDNLKRECWDAMKVKGRSVKAFHSDYEVKNYPLKERSKQALEELRRVKQMREIEKAQCTMQEEEGQRVDIKSSFSFEFGFSSPYIYDQFEVRSREQIVNQIILLQDVIYQVKTAFNKEFDAAHKQKVNELNNIQHRNSRIKELMTDLDLHDKIWEPSLTVAECPEKLLTVQDSEITAEKYLTPEQKEEQEKKELEEKRRLASKNDNTRERALDDMMDGVLEVKKEDILKLEIPPPEFVLTKPESQWNEEEKRIHKEYEKKSKKLSEEKEKYRKIMESEMKKLQTATKEATEKFDETPAKLFERKIKCEMAIYQEQLKMTYLLYSLLIEEEMGNREVELKLKLEQVLTYKDDIAVEVVKCEDEVEQFRMIYDTKVAEDKDLDKEFRKEFSDVPSHFVDELYKLFKRRPRGQKMRAQITKTLIPFKDPTLCGSMAPESLGNLLKAVDEMDSPQNMPEGLSSFIWDRFCTFRRTKIEREHKVKMNALTLAEMQAFLQKRREEERAATEEIQTMSEELERLHKVKSRFMADIKVQFLLKWGQVEESNTELTVNYSNSLLLHRRVVEDLNKSVRILGEQKISTMVACKDFRKGFIQQEWEHKKKTIQIEDRENKARDIQMLKISEEQQEFLQKTDRDSRMSQKVHILEKTIAFQEKSHLKNVAHRKKKIEQLKRQATLKCDKTSVFDFQLSDMEVAVAERKEIHHRIATDEPSLKTEERYQEIVQRGKLKDLAQAQAEELSLLWAEVERLRTRNFPSLNRLKHH